MFRIYYIDTEISFFCHPCFKKSEYQHNTHTITHNISRADYYNLMEMAIEKLAVCPRANKRIPHH